MKVEIWSDIMCPYCYIGKRKYEQALKMFPHAAEIETHWRSYQLDPEILPGNKQKHYDYIAEMKGWSMKETIEAHDELVQSAKEVGLDFRFDRVVVANTFNAHRLIHLADKKGLQDAAEEHFFKAFFVDGKDINDKDTLVQIGKSIGLDEKDILRMLDSESLTEEVSRDLEEAEEVDVDVIPFFLFNGQLILTGAQSPEIFLDALNQSYEKWKANQSSTDKERREGDGPSCSIDGVCE